MDALQGSEENGKGCKACAEPEGAGRRWPQEKRGEPRARLEGDDDLLPLRAEQKGPGLCYSEIRVWPSSGSQVVLSLRG